MYFFSREMFFFSFLLIFKLCCRHLLPILDINPIISLWVCKHFLLFSCLSFHSFENVLWCMKVNFFESQCIYFSLFSVFLVSYLMNSEQSQGHGDVHVCFSYITVGSVQFHCSVVSDSLWPHEPSTPGLPVHHQLSGVYSNPFPLSRWCHPAISSSVIPFSSCPQSFPASGSFQVSQLFTSGGQSIRVSASTLVLPVNTQDWSPLGWTGWISLQSKGLSRVFSNTTVQKHPFFSPQLSL